MRNSDEMNLVKYLNLLKRMCEPDVSLRETDKTPEDIIVYGFEKLSFSDKVSVLKMVEFKGELREEDKAEIKETVTSTSSDLMTAVGKVRDTVITVIIVVFGMFVIFTTGLALVVTFGFDSIMKFFGI